jgi:hypothetical protein
MKGLGSNKSRGGVRRREGEARGDEEGGRRRREEEGGRRKE